MISCSWGWEGRGLGGAGLAHLTTFIKDCFYFMQSNVCPCLYIVIEKAKEVNIKLQYGVAHGEIMFAGEGKTTQKKKN